MSGPTPAQRTVLRTYDYLDADGQTVLFQVQRLAPKAFRVIVPDGKGGQVYSLNGARRVLYQLPRVLSAARAGERVWVVGGEKDVETLQKLGHVATCSPLGPGYWRPEFAESLKGARVGVVASAHEEGYRHALTVASSLDAAGIQTTLLQFGCGCRDVTQHVGKGHELKDLRPFRRAAAQAALEHGTLPCDYCRKGAPELFTAPGGMARVCAKCLAHALEAEAVLNVEASGQAPASGQRKRSPIVSAREFCARPDPDGSLRLLGPMVWRGMRLSIGALTGEGKTTFGCQMVRAIVRGERFLDWEGAGGKALVVDVEQGEQTVKQRLRDLNLHEDPDVDILWEPDGLALDQSDEDRRYVEDGLRRGAYDVALFDPLYQLHCGDENSERTAAGLMRVLDGWSREYGLGIIIPMHRRKPHPQAGLNAFTINDIGGHGAWVRNSEIVLGLQFVHPGRSILRYFKDRPGFLPGVGTHWQLGFDRETFRFSRADEEEHGWTVTKQALAAEPGLTAAELAAHHDPPVTPATIRGHLTKIRAYADRPDAPLADRRWSLEPWPSAQTSILDEAEMT